ncbi:MAG TPA: trypsin-like peptidase domain-containing protein, partial [Gemmatimonadales bacterium]|nr:trypsin-like peptidase domain-containing protein [Gemmatimonadales bacterium]
MSVRSLNWLKFGGLVGLAFVLGLFFAGLLDLPKNSLAQSAVTRLTGNQPAIRPVTAPPLPAARPLVELSDAFSAVAEHVRPSVVFVKSERKERVAQLQVPRGFEPFFNFPQQQRRQPMIERGSGSGFIVSEDGYILTNNHVVDGAEKVTVQLLDHRLFPARVVGSDPNTDVAVIKIETRGLTAAALGSSAATRIGEWVLAVGNPLGENLTFTVTSGIVSAKGRGLPGLPGRSERSIQDFIQTDAAINPGNSGGPLVNVRGEVIGINSAIASETGYNMGYGFAIPIDLAKQVMEQLIKNGKVERAALGVFIEDVTPNDAKYVGLPEVRGVRIRNYSDENSPAKQAGLEPGDVIITIDGQNVDYVAQLQQVVAFKHPGETVKVEVARKGGERRTYSVRLIAASTLKQQTVQANGNEEQTPEKADTPAGATIRSLGITVSPLSAVQASELSLPASVHGLLVQNVDADGPAAEYLVGANGNDSPDVIVSVEGMPVRSEGELRTALRRAGPDGIVTLIVYNAQ